MTKTFELTTVIAISSARSHGGPRGTMPPAKPDCPPAQGGDCPVALPPK